MKKFSVTQLAKLAGVSVRTLHHYDSIGLLKPGERSGSNYRYYGETELLRLQQILFYRELDIPLAKIGDILDAPDFDIHTALLSHRKELQKRKLRMTELLKTIDTTLTHLKNKKMKFEDMYKGFSKEQAEAYEKEAKERWGSSIVEESKQRVMKMGREGLDAMKQEGDDICKELVTLIHLPVSDEKVQAQVKRHHAMIGRFYTVTPQIYQGLATMYVDDERFRKNYDPYHPQLAEFMRDAMLHFCKGL